MTDDSIKVALRIRPLVRTEIEKASAIVIAKQQNLPQVVIKTGRSKDTFAYDYVFAAEETQEMVYENSVKSMVQKLFDGYNVTILAYGQTGSGKTYTMGTTFNGQFNDDIGVIPRAISDIFEKIELMPGTDVSITCSFIELYKEQLFDLLSPQKSIVDIREDPTRNIIIPNLTEISVKSMEETIKCLSDGSIGRAVGATAMNDVSSRSHAIFTITVDVITKSKKSTKAKFHLVDLAGSERSKKTKATGERFKEGVKINQGLLSLGNVIKGLCDQASYICYRDSKLTRLLQDSLGGNSLTLMIACVSPADLNMEESLGTLRYANSAKHIKNKPVVNEDPKMAEINRLNEIIQELRVLLVEKGESQRSIISSQSIEDLYLLKNKLNDLEVENLKLIADLESALCDIASMEHRTTILEEFFINIRNCKNKFENAKEKLNADEPVEITELVNDVLLNIQTALNIVEADQNDQKNECYTSENSETIESESDFTKRQQSYRSQLKELKFNLEVKEMIYQKVVEAKSDGKNQKLPDDKAIREYEQKIYALEQEKEKLMEMCKNKKYDKTYHDRIKELEKQISTVKGENAKLISSARLQEKNFTGIQDEILNLKRSKVKLTQEMRSDSQRFKNWKAQQLKEMNQLRQKDRKLEADIKRKEILHQRQQNVLKRKVEEAVAVNKRLKNAIERQKNVQSMRNTKPNNGRKDTVTPWLEEELEMIYSTVDADFTIQQLIEDRATINKQLIELKKQIPMNKELIISLEEDVETRKVQIADLQEKIKSTNLDEQIQNASQNVQTMNDAKTMVKHLLLTIARSRNERISMHTKLNDLKIEREAEQRTLYLKEEQHSKDIEHLRNENNKVEKNLEKKIELLLKEMNKLRKNDAETEETQEIEKETISYLRQKNEKLEEELNQLKMLHQKKRIKKEPIVHEIDNMSDEENLTFVDDDSDDPDWRKTPQVRNRRQEKNKNVSTETMNTTDSNSGFAKPSLRETRKRSTENMGCSCKTNCKTKICGCKRSNKLCGETCKCPAECINFNQSTIDNCILSDRSDENIEKANFNCTPLKKPKYDADCTTPYPYNKVKPRKPLLDE